MWDLLAENTSTSTTLFSTCQLNGTWSPVSLTCMSLSGLLQGEYYHVSLLTDMYHIHCVNTATEIFPTLSSHSCQSSSKMTGRIGTFLSFYSCFWQKYTSEAIIVLIALQARGEDKNWIFCARPGQPLAWEEGSRPQHHHHHQYSQRHHHSRDHQHHCHRYG